MSAESRSPDVDVIVIGGGVNGTGVARDATLRGLRVALFERNDIGFGASGNSSGMIHGGPRYLTKNPEVTYTSCLDSGHIQKIAPHLLFRVPFLVTVFGEGLVAKTELATYDAFFNVYDRYQHLKRGQPHLRFSGGEIAALEPGLVPTSGGVSFDEWGIDGVRLCVTSLRDAVLRGAQAYIGRTVTGLIRSKGGAVGGVTYFDKKTRQSGKLTARAVVNATGAWAPITAQLSNLAPSAVRLRPGKGIHVYLDRRLSNYAIVTKAADGREVFLLPWQNMSVLGTTDDDYYGDLDDVVANVDEVRYLTEAVARVFPAVSTARAIGTFGGVRPTLFGWGQMESALSREHEVVDHSRDGAPGFYSMLGGKLASYRLFAEEMTDVLGRQLQVSARCQTHQLSLPGGDETLSPAEIQADFGLDALTARRLIYRHGSLAREVLSPTQTTPSQRQIICPCEPVTEAEVRHVIRHEWATSVADVSRRTRLGLGPCGGLNCAISCGRIVADACGLSPEEGRKSAAEFLRASQRRRLPALGPEQAKQEALTAAHVYAELGLRAGDAS